jgi:hypothetical protein
MVVNSACRSPIENAPIIRPRRASLRAVQRPSSSEPDPVRTALVHTVPGDDAVIERTDIGRVAGRWGQVPDAM